MIALKCSLEESKSPVDLRVLNTRLTSRAQDWLGSRAAVWVGSIVSKLSGRSVVQCAAIAIPELHTSLELG